MRVCVCVCRVCAGYLGLTIDPVSVLESFRAQAQQDRQRADRQ